MQIIVIIVTVFLFCFVLFFVFLVCCCPSTLPTYIVLVVVVVFLVCFFQERKKPPYPPPPRRYFFFLLLFDCPHQFKRNFSAHAGRIKQVTFFTHSPPHSAASGVLVSTQRKHVKLKTALFWRLGSLYPRKLFHWFSFKKKTKNKTKQKTSLEKKNVPRMSRESRLRNKATLFRTKVRFV